MTRGFITVAQNSPTGDYVRAAYGLALSLKRTQSRHSGLTIMITPGTEVPEQYRPAFDHIVEIPWGDMARHAEWKIHNKWKVYYGSPYDETILMDADMLVPVDLDGYWNILRKRSVFACTSPYTFRGEPIRDSIYRGAFNQTGLPHVYTAFLYFKKDHAASVYFRMVERVYRKWNDLRSTMRGLPEQVSGDLAFAMAMRLLGKEHDYTSEEWPGIVHMKSKLQRIGTAVDEDWTRHLNASVHRDGSIMVGGYRQIRPFHYHIRSFLTDDILETLSG